jgi:hypothetical protein
LGLAALEDDRQWMAGMEPDRPWSNVSIHDQTMTKMIIRNCSKQIVLGDSISVADTAAERRTGLLRHTGLAQGEGLWIVPCEAIHTFRMKFPIDVIFIDRKKRVTKIVPNMKRSRLAMSWRARSVIELAAGAAQETGTEIGDQLEMEKLDA